MGTEIEYLLVYLLHRCCILMGISLAKDQTFFHLYVQQNANFCLYMKIASGYYIVIDCNILYSNSYYQI